MKNSKTRLWWVRHAPVVKEMSDVIYGQRDVDVDLSNTQALKALWRILPKEATWIVSTLERTHKTALAICEQGGGEAPELKVVKGLEEQGFGKWETKTWNELGTEPAAIQFWRDPVRMQPPGGESFLDVIERAALSIRTLVREEPPGDFILVGHAGPIRSALALALNLDPAVALRFEIAPLGITRIDYIDIMDDEPMWSVVQTNRPAV